MALNPNVSQLDLPQIQKRTIDALNDAVRIILAETTGIAIELSAADGDSILSEASLASQSGSLTVGSSGELVAALDVSNKKEIQVLVAVGAGITGTATVSIEISPEASGSVWIPAGVTLVVTGATNLKSTKVSDIARRARVVLSGVNSISAGTATLHLLARS
jgi:hypothetical protein